jgi:capsular polysaccharide biosynthesis protein
MRSFLVVVAAGFLAGLAAGAIWMWAQPDRYRADARVLVRPQSSRIVPAVEALAESSLIASNVAQTLHLSSPPHISAKTGMGGVLTVSVEAGSRERARQIDAEAVVVLTQKVEERFGASPGVTATLLDPAHTAEQTSPTPGRNFLVAALIGLAAGIAVAAATRRREPAENRGQGLDPDAERRLRARIEEVAKRERALARRAAELAEREKRLHRREEELLAAAVRPSPSPPVPREPEPVAVPEAPEQEPEPPTPPEPVPGEWTLRALERGVQEHANTDPVRYEEWKTYLFFLREHADHDGRLPSSFRGLVADVFGDLIEGRLPPPSPS